MTKTMLRVGTASALILAATTATSAFAQDTTTTETAKTTTMAPTVTTKTKTKTKVKAPATATTPATTTESSTTTQDATTASAATDPTAPAAPVPTAGAAPAAAAPTVPNPTVGGAAMEATKTIVDNASAAPNLTTLVSAVKAADLATTLSGPGPFTVFAPTNDAFGRLAPGTVDTLLKPENKTSLQKVLKYHVVPGTLTIADLKAKVAAGGGTAALTTVEGGTLTAKVNKTAQGDAVELTDANGNKSYVETGDVRQSNGIVHVVNGVVIPKLAATPAAK